MTTQVISEDYGTTVSPDTYVAGIRVHLWLATMYELMIQEALTRIRKCIELNPDQKVIVYDFGCGPGHFTIALAERVEQELKIQARMVSVVGIDSSPSFIDHAFVSSFHLHPDARQMIRFVCGDMFDVQYEPADIITASGFVHHFPLEQQEMVIGKMATLLKRDGVLIHGDEHPAPGDWFEREFPGEGRRLSLCALYFQVIAAAHRSKSKELQEAETENFLAEVYRDHGGVPNVERERLMSFVEVSAVSFMQDLLLDGLRKVCRAHALTLFETIKKTVEPHGTHAGLYDRGDFKVPLIEFVKMAKAQNLLLHTIHDTGNNRVLGSAPVVVFNKK